MRRDAASKLADPRKRSTQLLTLRNPSEIRDCLRFNRSERTGDIALNGILHSQAAERNARNSTDAVMVFEATPARLNDGRERGCPTNDSQWLLALAGNKTPNEYQPHVGGVPFLVVRDFRHFRQHARPVAGEWDRARWRLLLGTESAPIGGLLLELRALANSYSRCSLNELGRKAFDESYGRRRTRAKKPSSAGASPTYRRICTRGWFLRVDR